MKKSEFLKICQKCNGLCCKLGGTNLTKEEVSKVIDAGFDNHFAEIVSGIYELKSKKDGVCPYLMEDLSCEIHEVKPLICSCWPFFPEFENGRVEQVLINCPLTKHLSTEELEICRKEAMDVTQKVAEISADDSLIPKEQHCLILQRYKQIEEYE